MVRKVCIVGFALIVVGILWFIVESPAVRSGNKAWVIYESDGDWHSRRDQISAILVACGGLLVSVCALIAKAVWADKPHIRHDANHRA